MDPKFYNIYEDLYRFPEDVPFRYRVRWLRRLGFPYPTPISAEWVRESIDRANADFGAGLRPDAKVFLLSNFFDMILLPLSHPDSPFRDGEAKLISAVSEDIRTIVRAASQNREGDETTAADILKATGENLGELQVNSFRFWGPKVRDGE